MWVDIYHYQYVRRDDSEGEVATYLLEAIEVIKDVGQNEIKKRPMPSFNSIQALSEENSMYDSPKLRQVVLIQTRCQNNKQPNAIREHTCKGVPVKIILLALAYFLISCTSLRIKLSICFSWLHCGCKQTTNLLSIFFRR